MTVMIDSNIFDKLYDNRLGITKSIINLIAEHKIVIYSTTVQSEETLKIVDSNKAMWISNFAKKWVKPIKPPFAWGVPGAGWKESTWGSEQENNAYYKIKPNAKKQNHIADKLIVLSALRLQENTCFVTEDKDLIHAIRTSELKLNIMDWGKFVLLLNNM